MTEHKSERLWRTLLLIPAASAPLAFPLSQAGYGSLHDLGLRLILPGAAALLGAWWILNRGWAPHRRTARLLYEGAVAGILATLALEAVRYAGFRMGFMPGNLPRLMGVLLLDRFALGPSGLSDLAGFAYHFWNGASFGMMLTLVAGACSIPLAVGYGVAIGVGFMVSPVVLALGVGYFGRDFGWSFAATVLLAHAAFGIALGSLLRWLAECLPATEPRRGRGHGLVPGHSTKVSRAT
jgi:hypothetical protein